MFNPLHFSLIFVRMRERERERERECMRGRIKGKENRKEMHTYLIYIVFLNLARDPGAIKRKATLLLIHLHVGRQIIFSVPKK